MLVLWARLSQGRRESGIIPIVELSFTCQIPGWPTSLHNVEVYHIIYKWMFMVHGSLVCFAYIDWHRRRKFDTQNSDVARYFVYVMQ